MSHTVKPDKPTIALVGLATAWMTLYPVLLFFRLVERVFASICFSAFCTPNRPVSGGFAALIDNPLVIYLSVLMYFALITFYLDHISENTTTSATAKFFWSIGITFLPLIAMPIYYLRFIVLHDRRAGSKTSDSLSNAGETRQEEVCP
jgi:hypothetical protein